MPRCYATLQEMPVILRDGHGYLTGPGAPPGFVPPVLWTMATGRSVALAVQSAPEIRHGRRLHRLPGAVFPAFAFNARTFLMDQSDTKKLKTDSANATIAKASMGHSWKLRSAISGIVAQVALRRGLAPMAG